MDKNYIYQILIRDWPEKSLGTDIMVQVSDYRKNELFENFE